MVHQRPTLMERNNNDPHVQPKYRKADITTIESHIAHNNNGEKTIIVVHMY